MNRSILHVERIVPFALFELVTIEKSIFLTPSGSVGSCIFEKVASVLVTVGLGRLAIVDGASL